jgi:ArsR family transcriptional regulator, arsenate/arsenite/antimonite-responsive transcriptional repressor
MMDVDRLAAAFKALSNPQRLRMFIKLATACCAPGARRSAQAARFCCAGEVGAGLNLASSTVSHHLKELRQAGLMHVERHGQRIDCWASEETLQLLASFFTAWGSSRRTPTRGSPRVRPLLEGGDTR